jgi:transcription antitermination factor NusG
VAQLIQGWAVMMTASNMERKVLRGCEPHGLKSHLFLYLDSRRRERILFGGYVMAYVNNDSWHKIFSVPGSQRVLLNGDVPALVRPSVMANLRAREDENGYIKLPERFDLDQKLVVQNGAYRNQVVLYKGMSADQRELALFSLLGCDVVAEFDYDDLAPLGQLAAA